MPCRLNKNLTVYMSTTCCCVYAAGLVPEESDAVDPDEAVALGAAVQVSSLAASPASKDSCFQPAMAEVLVTFTTCALALSVVLSGVTDPKHHS
jgi:molecular chaperone DnaK (HSP70)